MSKEFKVFIGVFGLLLIIGFFYYTSAGRNIISYTSVKVIEEIKWIPLKLKLDKPSKQLTIADMEAVQQYANDKKLLSTIGKIPTIKIGIYNGRSIILRGSSCWGGDYCPSNEVTWITFYEDSIPENECGSLNGDPIITVGWGKHYHGCSPIF